LKSRSSPSPQAQERKEETTPGHPHPERKREKPVRRRKREKRFDQLHGRKNPPSCLPTAKKKEGFDDAAPPSRRGEHVGMRSPTRYAKKRKHWPGISKRNDQFSCKAGANHVVNRPREWKRPPIIKKEKKTSNKSIPGGQWGEKPKGKAMLASYSGEKGGFLGVRGGGRGSASAWYLSEGRKGFAIECGRQGLRKPGWLPHRKKGRRNVLTEREKQRCPVKETGECFLACVERNSSRPRQKKDERLRVRKGKAGG